MKQTKD